MTDPHAVETNYRGVSLAGRMGTNGPHSAVPGASRQTTPRLAGPENDRSTA